MEKAEEGTVFLLRLLNWSGVEMPKRMGAFVTGTLVSGRWRTVSGGFPEEHCTTRTTMGREFKSKTNTLGKQTLCLMERNAKFSFPRKDKTRSRFHGEMGLNNDDAALLL